MTFALASQKSIKKWKGIILLLYMFGENVPSHVYYISADTRHQEMCAAVSTQQPNLTSFLKYSFAKIILLIDGAEGGDCLSFHRQMDVQNMVT